MFLSLKKLIAVKPIQKVTTKNDTLRPAMNFFQVKDGYANATNGYALIKIPVKEILPGLITAEDELYFKGDLWAAMKMDKAASIEREGLLFTALDKNKKIIGSIKALTAEDLKKVSASRYPDVDAVLPSADRKLSVDQIGINPLRLGDLCAAFACDNESFKYVFFGAKRGVSVENKDSMALGLIMPTKLWEREAEATEVKTDDDFDVDSIL